MADAGPSRQRLIEKSSFEIAQLAFRAPARKRAILNRCDASRIVAAIFKPTQRID
jgi:hypothetical protein